MADDNVLRKFCQQKIETIFRLRNCRINENSIPVPRVVGARHDVIPNRWLQIRNIALARFHAAALLLSIRADDLEQAAAVGDISVRFH